MGHWRSNIFVRPNRVRDHTMYHRDSGGGISYAEFRHLGKEGVLGKYSIHFHLVGDTMRGSGVLGASIWDSHNRRLTRLPKTAAPEDGRTPAAHGDLIAA